MVNGPHLELRQKQALVMVPQLQQAIKLLQMSQAELTAFIEKELEKNPLLEREENQSGTEEKETFQTKNTDNDSSTQSADHNPADQESHTSPSSSTETESIQTEKKENRETEQTDLQELHLGERQAEHTAQPELDSDSTTLYDDPYGYASAHTYSTQTRSNHSAEDFDPFENQADSKTLKQHLTEQLATLAHSQLDHTIALYLIDQVNENGYLTTRLEDISEKLGIAQTHIEKILSLLQSFEPTGVMARSVEECLRLQLMERNQFDEKMRILLEHLPLLAQSSFKKLARLCSVELKELNEMISKIRTLSPKPGLAYGGEVSPAVIPDVFIYAHPDGGWRIELNSESLPKLLINMHYYTEVHHKSQHKEEKSFISECHKNASWLMKSLDQRARTILKVTREIVKQQDAFLAHGITYLKPLTLKHVAEAVEMHESTISRVTMNKYLATPRGIFEMKFFFSSALTTSNGNTEVSAEAVRHMIKTLVTKETVDSVLSDDKIMEHLQKTGIDIARRTIAKYREAMQIPSSAERKRQLKRISS